MLTFDRPLSTRQNRTHSQAIVRSGGGSTSLRRDRRPIYTDPGTAAEARKAIALLTNFTKEEVVDSIDANVKAYTRQCIPSTRAYNN